jgi:hypothetical protein
MKPELQNANDLPEFSRKEKVVLSYTEELQPLLLH